jgi:hypothetical protein
LPGSSPCVDVRLPIMWLMGFMTISLRRAVLPRALGC